MWGAIIQAVLGAEGQYQAGKISAQQLDLLKSQLAQVAGITVPDLERIKAEQLGQSHVSQIETDNNLRDDQLQTLSALKDLATGEGMSLADKVGFEEANAAANSADYGRRSDILSQMQRRGQLDSGASLAAQLNSAQDAANRSRKSGQEFAARGEDRRMQAYRDLMSGAGNLRNQDFGEAKAKADAQDAIDRWNANERSQANKYNAGLGQQDFTNRMSKATGQLAPGNNLSNYYAQSANNTRNTYSNLGTQAGLAANWFANNQSSGGSSDMGGGAYSQDELNQEIDNERGQDE